MANPMNISVLTGRLTADPVFIKNSQGVEFAVNFTLAVQRNYKKKTGDKAGEYEVDFIPIRYEGEKRMNFAHMLKKGNTVTLSGALKSESYEKNGETVYTLYLLAESIQYTPSTKKSDEDIDDICDDTFEDCDLPLPV